VPEPKRASRRARHPLVIAGNAIFTIILIVAIAVGIAYSFGKHKFDAAGPLDREKIVNIPRGLGLREIADLLARENVIDQPWVFIGGVLVLKARDDLKFGEYKFAGRSPCGAIETIVEIGRSTPSRSRGAHLEQIGAARQSISRRQYPRIPKEGTLLPETYKFTRGMSRAQIIQRMQQAHKRVLQEVWEHRVADIPIKTPEQLVTLASIVEKETGRADERTRVAAVFINRLKSRMRLQSDPTIIYGLTGGKGSLGRPIMKSEIEQSTPYNTYLIDGLPPGPIANPGRASLEAAANPARTKELYFVADGSGGHVFSDNYNEHQKNVGRLRSIERGDTPPPPPVAAPASAPATNGNRNGAKR
jgi:UPF0755 protein